MEKMNLETFRSIKERIKTILEKVEKADESSEEYSEEQLQELLQEYVNSIKELENSDLSEIPFEEWEGMYLEHSPNEGMDLDLSKTHANLDFSIINFGYEKTHYSFSNILQEKSPNFKGCSIKNYDFKDFYYDEEMFDEEFIKQNSEHFILKDIITKSSNVENDEQEVKGIPEDVRKRFYNGSLTLEDATKYEFFKDKISEDILDRYEVELFNLLGKDEFLKLDSEFVGPIHTWTLNKLKENPDLKNEPNIMDFLYEEARKDIFKISTGHFPDNFYVKSTDLGKGFREKNPDLFLPEEAPEELKDKFYNRQIGFRDYAENIDYFENVKGFVGFRTYSDSDREMVRYLGNDMYSIFKEYGDIILNPILNQYRYSVPENTEDTVEEKLKVLKEISKKYYTNYKTFKDIQDVEKLIPVEEIIENKKLLSLIQKVGVSRLMEMGFNEIEPFSKETFSLEDISKLQKEVEIDLIPLGKNENAKRNFISKYGIDNIIRLDEETNGIFSYKSNSFSDMNLLIFALQEAKEPKREDEEPVKSYEEFKEKMYQLLVSARKRDGIIRTTQYIGDYGIAQGEFRREHQDIFIDDDVAPEIKTNFYKGILSAENIREHPELTEKLKDKNLELAFSLNVQYPGLKTPDGMIAGFVTESFSKLVKEKFDNETFLELCQKYGACLDNIKLLNLSTNNFTSLEDLEDQIQEDIFKEIKNNGLVYFDYLPETFKQKHPEIFLPENVPDEFRNKFYSGNLKCQTIHEYPKLKQLLLEKDFSVATRRTNLKNLNINREDLINLALEYGEYLDNILPVVFDNNLTYEEMDSIVQRNIEEKILSQNINYSENAPEFFKKEYPELFLSEDAPELLKLAYYSSYISKDTEYKNHSSSNYSFSLELLKEHPEYREYLKDKDFKLVTNKEISKLANVFETEEIFEILDIDSESLDIFSREPIENIKKFKKNILEKPKYFAIKELKELDGYKEEEIEAALSSENTDNENFLKIRKLYENKIEKFKELIIQNPGYTLYYPEEKDEEFNFSEYKELKNMSKFTVSDDYRRGVAEQIIATMYDFLGYANAKEVLKLPEIEESRLEEIIHTHEQAFSEIYEEKFKITGNLKVLNTLFDKYAPLLPGKKGTLNVYKTLNQKLEEGFSGNLEELLIECLKENQCKFDEDKIKNVARLTMEVNAQEKMSVLSDKITEEINQHISETSANKKILNDILVNSYRRSLSENEILDETFIKTYIEKEFKRVKEDGTSFYSPHVTNHLEDLLNITQSINNDRELGKIANSSAVDILKAEKEKIGNGWIRKILSVQEELSKQELEDLNKKLYGENQEIRIPTKRSVELKNKSEEGVKEAYILLKKLELPGIFTYEKGEQMFMGLLKPYSENFKDFFVKNQKEILRKPEYYTKFQKMNAEFEKIIEDPHIFNRYKAGEYTLNELIDELNRTTFDNVSMGEWNLEYRARKAGMERQYFPRAQEVLKEMQEREYQTIPPIEYNGEKYRGRILRIDDPLHLVIGNITTCCQKFGENQYGEPSMVHSATEENGSVFIIEKIDDKGRAIGGPIAQSWTWRNGDRVCFDNVEIPNTLESNLKKEKAHDEILKIYSKAAEKMIEIDKKALKAMLEAGKITQEQYDNLVLKEVTIGAGCDDLIKNLSLEMKKSLKKTSIVLPIEKDKAYRTVEGIGKKPWIDSDETQYSIAQNEEEIEKENMTPHQGKIPIQYTKIRETIKRSGREINLDLVEQMKSMLNVARKAETSIIGKMEGNRISELFEENYDIEDENAVSLSISENEDWYILSKEDDKTIQILDSLIVKGKNPVEVQKPIDTELAKYEYLSELFTLMQVASESGKTLTINLERENEYINFKPLVEKGIISMNNDKINVNNLDELTKQKAELNKRIEKTKEKRILASFEENNDSKENHEDDNLEI